MSTSLLATAERLTIALGLAVAALCGMAWGPSGFLSAGIGGALAAANLWVVRRLAGRAVQSTLAAAEPRGIGALLGAMFGKMVALFALVWIGVRVVKLSLVPFTLGLFVFVVALLGAGLWWGFKVEKRSPLDPLNEDGQGAA